MSLLFRSIEHDFSSSRLFPASSTSYCQDCIAFFTSITSRPPNQLPTVSSNPPQSSHFPHHSSTKHAATFHRSSHLVPSQTPLQSPPYLQTPPRNDMDTVYRSNSRLPRCGFYFLFINDSHLPLRNIISLHIPRLDDMGN